MSFSRTLTFRTDSTSITSSVTIMLTFDQVPSTPSLNQVAWRVLNFGTGGQSSVVTYAQNLLFASLQVNSGNLVTAVANQVLSLGQQTTLVEGAGGVGVEFTSPTDGNTGELIATNKSGGPQGLAIGYLDPATQLPDPLLVWKNVGNDNSVAAVYTPVLKAYVTSQYQQTELITGEIVSPVLLSQNLALLPPTQTYTLVKNADGSYALNADGLADFDPRNRIKIDPSPNDYYLGEPNSIKVTNQLRFDIYVKVSASSKRGDEESFARIHPGDTKSWARSGPEVISVNVGGGGQVAQFFGIVGKNLQVTA